MDLLIEYFNKIGSEVEITEFGKIVYSSANYEKVNSSKLISNNIYSCESKFFQKKITSLGNYMITSYDDVTRFANEIIISKTDCLTKLPNRTQIEKYVSKINEPCVVVMSDIDNFKRINDEYGHQVGDEVIKLIGDLIRSIIGKDVFVGRYGGEEFLFVFETIDINFVKKKMDEFNAFLNRYTGNMKVSVSTGIYSFDPNLERVDSAIRKADEALYFVKHNGKNASIVYDDIKKYKNTSI